MFVLLFVFVMLIDVMFLILLLLFDFLVLIFANGLFISAYLLVQWFFIFYLSPCFLFVLFVVRFLHLLCHECTILQSHRCNIKNKNKINYK